MWDSTPERYMGVPLEPFVLAPGEPLHRPETVRRLAFEHVFPRAYWFDTAPFARAIVPIELARQGDEQVVVHRRMDERFPEPLSIDFLDGLPSVVSVVAGRLVIARRLLPQIRELFVLDQFVTIDQETLANLPGLVSLSLGSGWEGGLDQNMPNLRDLRFRAGAVQSLEPLQSLKGLERLRIEGHSAQRDAGLLSGLANLRCLALDGWKWLRRLGALENLEQVELMDASLANFKPFGAWRKLRRLALSGRGVKSLEGIQTLESLEALFLGRPGIWDLTPLARLSNLRRLRLVGADWVTDFSPLGRLENLRTLNISLGSVASTEYLANLDFVAGLVHLKELAIENAQIVDGRLDALFDLPELERVFLLGDFGDQVERLRRQKPDCDIQVFYPDKDGLEIIHPVGDLEIREHGRSYWQIFQDLSDLLGVEDNILADRRIRRAIRQQDAELRERLEFDPDIDFVSIIAGSQADIRRAAAIIQALIDSPQHRV